MRPAKRSAVSLGIAGTQVPLHSHLCYLWESDNEFADAVDFLEAGLRRSDHCAIFGHHEANERVCNILRSRGFDVNSLLEARRLAVFGGQSTAYSILQAILADFERAIDGGAAVIRLLGNIGWGKSDWPDDEDFLALESKITATASQFPTVILCMYDVTNTPGPLIRHGALETHLQEQEFEPVGSSRTVRVNVRVIAATNRNLEEAIAEGHFRADLYYRLNVVPVPVPALRERRSDIPELVLFFVRGFAKKFAKKVEGVSRETMDRLTRYARNGNVRELQNVIERAVVLSDRPVLALNENLLPNAEPEERAAASAVAAAAPSQGKSASGSVRISLAEVERRHILGVLEKSGWVIEGPAGAAKSLDVNANILRSRMKKLGIRRPSRE